MTEKAKNDLTIELMRRYNITVPDDDSEVKPPKPPSEAAASDPFYSTPAPAVQSADVVINPLLKIQEEEDLKKQKQKPENVLERNQGLSELGAVLGGAAQYKGVGQNLFTPVSNLFAPSAATVPSGQMVDVPPTTQAMSTVQHTMQSGQGKMPGVTGREREGTHNFETQRQAYATQENIEAPGAKKAIVEAGPMVTNKAGFSVPLRTAMSMEEELQAKQAAEAEQRRQLLEKQALDQQRLDRQRANRARVIGGAQGTGRVAQGVVGGALAVPQLYEYGRDVIKGDKTKPSDTTQGLSGLGGLMMALGRGKTGAVGALAQIPYMVKHRDEIARSMKMSDINPTAFMGMPDEFSGINTPPQPRPQPIRVNDGYGPVRQLPP